MLAVRWAPALLTTGNVAAWAAAASVGRATAWLTLLRNLERFAAVPAHLVAAWLAAVERHVEISALRDAKAAGIRGPRCWARRALRAVRARLARAAPPLTEHTGVHDLCQALGPVGWADALAGRPDV